MYLNNTFNILCIANVLNIACKTTNKKLRKNITTKVNNSKKKKLIKATSSIQKIMQRNNISSYY